MLTRGGRIGEVARLRSWALAIMALRQQRHDLCPGWVVLVITTIIRTISGSQLHFVLLHRSTNIAELGRDPLVLFSKPVVDRRPEFGTYLLFTLFLAPPSIGSATCVGSPRPLTSGATYLSEEGLLYLAIQHRCPLRRCLTSKPISGSATSWSV